MSANILIVDDEIFRYMVVDVLNQHGYSTVEMENGEKAFRYYAKHPEDVDLVILDMMLPEAGGGRIYKLLKQKYPHLKIILISG
jgi:two-component system cell cycle sensor histidine kinase/response regulator CckA